MMQMKEKIYVTTNENDLSDREETEIDLSENEHSNLVSGQHIIRFDFVPKYLWKRELPILQRLRAILSLSLFCVSLWCCYCWWWCCEPRWASLRIHTRFANMLLLYSTHILYKCSFLWRFDYTHWARDHLDTLCHRMHLTSAPLFLIRLEPYTQQQIVYCVRTNNATYIWFLLFYSPNNFSRSLFTLFVQLFAFVG